MSIVAIVLAMLGLALIGLSTDAHHRHRFGGCPAPRLRWRMRAAGWAGIAAGGVVAVAGHGWTFGPPVAIGTTMLGAGAAYLVLNFAGGPARRLLKPDK